ncbi:MAG: glycosyltransferase family 10 [Verrucomicrobiota bacterium]
MTAERIVLLVHNLMFDQPLDLEGQVPPEDCELTTDRSRHDEADAVIFHLPTLGDWRGLNKRPGQLWVGWTMECDAHYPAWQDPAYMMPFDLAMNYRRDADVIAPYYGMRLHKELARLPQPKTAAKPVACFISSSADRSGRSAYLSELMKHIEVDCYGRLSRNAMMEDDRGRESKLACIARYKFTLAFENALGKDYVTEKVYEPLMVGSVPVYMGTSDVGDFLPDAHCVIRTDAFESPRTLAEYLHELDTDEEAYAEYLAWKEKPLRDSFLRLLDQQRIHPFVRLCLKVKSILNRRGSP